MPKKLWKVHGLLQLTNTSTRAHQYAELDETLEEVTTPGGNPDEVRVFRTQEKHTIQSYNVSRAALEASATLV
jgi:hypothetical protein